MLTLGTSARVAAATRDLTRAHDHAKLGITFRVQLAQQRKIRPIGIGLHLFVSLNLVLPQLSELARDQIE
jgi:hypothetical protein